MLKGLYNVEQCTLYVKGTVNVKWEACPIHKEQTLSDQERIRYLGLFENCSYYCAYMVQKWHAESELKIKLFSSNIKNNIRVLRVPLWIDYAPL